MTRAKKLRIAEVLACFLLVAYALLHRFFRPGGVGNSELLLFAGLTLLVVAISIMQDYLLYCYCERLEAAVYRDELTGLLNRRGFMQMAEKALRRVRMHGGELTLVSIDLDGLKVINDVYGHAAGDQALMDAASILKRTFAPGGAIARIGGDEFAVLLNEGRAKALLNLQGNIDIYNSRSGRPLPLRMSVGSTRFDPDRDKSILDVMQRADQLMYDQKRARRWPVRDGVR